MKPDDLMKISSVAAPVRLQVVNSFRSAILAGRFQPGERLVEKDLCELTGASRTSVREALRQLETEGLVQMVPNKGPIVALISPEQARSIYEVRGALEALAGALFATRASDAQIAALEKTVEPVRKGNKSGTIEQILVAKDAFYDALLDGAGNDMIPSVLRMMQARISLLRRVSLGVTSRLDTSIAEIRDIVRAAKARDPAATSEACLRHVRNAAEAALALMTDTKK
jgi:DNA-binding GntR family transcriptional regulator